jgi:hypothetical protein
MCGACRPARPLLGVAASFSPRPVDADAVEDDLCALASCALAGRCAGPAAQLAALDGAMEPFARSDALVGLDDLLLDRVLATWAGSPALLCAIAAEAGARAGLEVAIAGDGTSHVVVHRSEDGCCWDPAAGVRGLAPGERAGLKVRCGHRLAFAVLGEVAERAGRAGDVAAALKATDLRLGMPLGASLRTRVEAERAGLLATLN